jgi:hypothetical protein
MEVQKMKIQFLGQGFKKEKYPLTLARVENKLYILVLGFYYRIIF